LRSLYLSDQEQQQLRKTIERFRTEMHTLDGRLGRVERAVWLGWPQATVFRCKP
jgi:hypothetical protein